MTLSVYQTPDTMTALTSTQTEIAVVTSTPSNKPLTVQQKATLYIPSTTWTAIEDDPYSLLCTSPTSGKVYKLTLNTFTGEIRCNCPSQYGCYHGEMFAIEWKPVMMAQAKSDAEWYRTNRTAIDAYMTRPAVSAATRSADWG